MYYVYLQMKWWFEDKCLQNFYDASMDQYSQIASLAQQLNDKRIDKKLKGIETKNGTDTTQK